MRLDAIKAVLTQHRRGELGVITPAMLEAAWAEYEEIVEPPRLHTVTPKRFRLLMDMSANPDDCRDCSEFMCIWPDCLPARDLSGDICRCGRSDLHNGSVVCWVCEEPVVEWDARKLGPLTAATLPG